MSNFHEGYATSNENLYGGAAKISRALDYAFVWEDSPEGNDYWKGIYNEYKSNGQ